MLKQLDLLTLLVEDLEAAKAFYCDVLRLPVIRDASGYVELDSGGVRLALYSRSALAELLQVDPAELGSIDLSFATTDVDGFFEELVARGADPVATPRTMPWGHRVAFFRDRDGNLVEIFDPIRVL
jgi:catechol 2,3-dioxygenase-like lactoylglutathione lyase family enzyme